MAYGLKLTNEQRELLNISLQKGKIFTLAELIYVLKRQLTKITFQKHLHQAYSYRKKILESTEISSEKNYCGLDHNLDSLAVVGLR